MIIHPIIFGTYTGRYTQAIPETLVILEESGYVITFILMAIIIFTSIWTGFYFYNRNEAKKYNAKIKEIEKENDN